VNDCANAEIRDQLPDLVHERLDAGALMIVMAHVDDCVDCRDELQLLRDVQSMLTRQAPAIDVAYIVGALPKAPAQTTAIPTIARKRSVWSDWRVAAAVTLLVAGGGSYALMHPDSADAPATAVQAVATPVATPVAPPAGAPTTAGTAAAPLVATTVADSPDESAATNEDRAAVEMGNDSRLGDLNEAQLQTLLNDVQHLKAVPATEPEPVTIRVDAKLSSEGM